MKNLKTKKILIAIFPIIFLLCMFLLRTYYYSIYEVIGREDHIIEWMQFFFFLASGILGIFFAVKIGKFSKLMKILFIIVSIGLIIVAKEEISWGERLFNVQAPEVFDGDSTVPLLGNNVQSEMNLHNFDVIHSNIGKVYIAIGTYAIFAYFISHLFYKVKEVSKKNKFLISFITPPPYLIFYFFPLYINLLNRRALGIKPQDYEMGEFLLSLGTLLFLIICIYRIKKQLESEEAKN